MAPYKTVQDVIHDLTSERQELVELLREIILATNPNLTEHIKWNSPSYILEGVDRITFNLHDSNKVRLILHCGAARKEDKKTTPILKTTSTLPEWNSDSRATITFFNVAEIKTKRAELQMLLRDWLAVSPT